MRDAWETRRKTFPPPSWRTAETELALAESLLAPGRLDTARPLLEESHRDFKAVFGEHHPTTIRAREDLKMAQSGSPGTSKRTE